MTLKEIIKLVYGQGVNCNEQPFDWSDERVIKEAVQAVKDRVKSKVLSEEEILDIMIWKANEEEAAQAVHTEMGKKTEEL